MGKGSNQQREVLDSVDSIEAITEIIRKGPLRTEGDWYNLLEAQGFGSQKVYEALKVLKVEDRKPENLAKLEGSIWRDYNDHLFEIKQAVIEKDGWVELRGIITYCNCGNQEMHANQPYTAYVQPEDDLAGGEIFGFTRMYPTLKMLRQA